MSVRQLSAAFVTLSLFLSSPPRPAPAQTVTYAYDELGRLVGVVDPNGTAAKIKYDAVGNRLSVATTNSNSVSIFSFSSDNGPTGMTVIIYGDGFSTTPTQNTVQFNGTAAVVSASTLTTITTAVPTGATTGTVAVTSPNGKATSSETFVVTAQ